MRISQKDCRKKRRLGEHCRARFNRSPNLAQKSKITKRPVPPGKEAMSSRPRGTAYKPFDIPSSGRPTQKKNYIPTEEKVGKIAVQAGSLLSVRWWSESGGPRWLSSGRLLKEREKKRRPLLPRKTLLSRPVLGEKFRREDNFPLFLVGEQTRAQSFSSFEQKRGQVPVEAFLSLRAGNSRREVRRGEEEGTGNRGDRPFSQRQSSSWEDPLSGKECPRKEALLNFSFLKALPMKRGSRQAT